jgi:hypothetical protein
VLYLPWGRLPNEVLLERLSAFVGHGMEITEKTNHHVNKMPHDEKLANLEKRGIPLDALKFADPFYQEVLRKTT